MKKTLLTLAVIMGFHCSYAQTNNTFPSNGNVGIGTTSPIAKLEVRGDIYWGSNSGELGTDANGAIELGPLNSNGSVPYIDWHYGVGSIQDYNVRLMNSGDNQFIISTASNGTVFAVNGGNVGIGTVTPTEKLSVNGNIRAREIKVENTSWPDYVFKKDYQLPTLEETENQIKEKGHLSGIPSAAEIKANGVDLGDMNAKLLKKIEELTLYLIEQQNQMEQLKQEQGNRITTLEKALLKLTASHNEQ